MMNVSLKVVGGELEAKEIALSLPATVGRGRDVAVSLPHPLVSRRHCEIVEREGTVLVRDLDSLNGTFVGSERVEEAVLNPGDLLTVGTVTFRAVYESELQTELETLVAEVPGPCHVDAAASRGTQHIRIDDTPLQPRPHELAARQPGVASSSVAESKSS